MSPKNYDGFIAYLQNNQVRYEEDPNTRLVRCGYNIEVGNIEIVADFEYEERIGFFSFLNMVSPEERKEEALKLINSFNESLNYGAIIISQSNQLVYKIMLNTLHTTIEDRHWAEMIYRLWSISRDIYPLFGRLFYNNETAKSLFLEFLQKKEREQKMDHPNLGGVSMQPDSDTKEPKGTRFDGRNIKRETESKESHDIPFDTEFRNWYNQN